MKEEIMRSQITQDCLIRQKRHEEERKKRLAQKDPNIIISEPKDAKLKSILEVKF